MYNVLTYFYFSVSINLSPVWYNRFTYFSPQLFFNMFYRCIPADVFYTKRVFFPLQQLIFVSQRIQSLWKYRCRTHNWKFPWAVVRPLVRAQARIHMFHLPKRRPRHSGNRAGCVFKTVARAPVLVYVNVFYSRRLKPRNRWAVGTARAR